MTQALDSVSLNGPDNAGKTTHLLVRPAEWWDCFQPLGAVHEHGMPWPQFRSLHLRNLRPCP